MKTFFTKAVLLLAFLGLSFTSAKAQYVTIPDSNFVAWLTINYPSCMNGNMMDTTCYEIATETIVNLNSQQISNIYGIQYFDSLTKISFDDNLLVNFPIFHQEITDLSCSQNLFSHLSNLPTSLINLSCGGVNLTSIDSLPNNLKIFECINSSIASLPTLPENLWSLTCIYGYGQLTALPNLPDSLKQLDCTGNSITYLPNLPTRLNILKCSENALTSMPSLPNTIFDLRCQTNQLTSLPSLPMFLTNLNFSYNSISSISNLPNTLITLQCNNNSLTSLPVLPNSLKNLYCSYNQINNLSALPNTLIALLCNNNNISCFPLFPSSIITQGAININNNPFNCIPNYIIAMDSATFTIPLCELNDLINNPNGCDEAVGILGTVFNDANSNCIMNFNDYKLKNVKINFYDPITTQFGATYSASNGIYHYSGDVAAYSVSVDTLNKPYQANCTYPGIDSIVVTTVANPLASNVNFDIKCKQGLDLNIQSVNHKDGWIFPGQQHTLQVMVGDASQWYGLNCASGTSGQVQVAITGPVTYSGVVPGALTPTINGNIYTYTIANFGTINNTTDFQLLFTTDSTATSGNQICVHVEVTPITGDINPSNNSMDYCYTVFNSYDPNFKEVYPTDVLPGFQDWLTYTVHFQNVGTAPAINIRLLDTLDANLNVETFEVINYSHYNTVTLMDGILDFRFPNILLPDSASNPAGSQGFVQYRIKPKANLIAGTQIENTAHIYFDFNPAVVTNTTTNNFMVNVGNKVLPLASRLLVYPNPSNGIFNISATANIEVYNILGELILSAKNTTSIDLTAAPKGVYFVKLNGSEINKLIKN